MGYSFNRTGRTAWEDRFREPTLDDLRGSYTKTLASLVDECRAKLVEFTGGEEDADEAISWQGLPWRWTLVYRCEGDPTEVFAYLVPDPEAPKLSLPLTAEMIQSMPVKRMKKHIRETLDHARCVGALRWPTFEVTSKSALVDVLDIAKRKRKFIEKQQKEAEAEAA